MTETFKHLGMHRTHLRLEIVGWRLKWCVQCDCPEHYLHLHFPFMRFRSAWDLACTW